MIQLGQEGSLITLFMGSLLSATLLPGGSEILFLAMLQQQSASLYALLLSATLGNTLGSVITLVMGRLVPQKRPPQRLELMRRYGSVALLLAWLPIIGDALCLAAGWLRLPWLAAITCIFLGKLARYAVLATLDATWFTTLLPA